MAEILKLCAPERFIAWDNIPPNVPRLLTQPLILRKMYGTVYLPRDEFEQGVLQKTSPGALLKDLSRHPRKVMLNWWNLKLWKKPIRCFVVIRDLRDALISYYFSMRMSHPVISPHISHARTVLNALEQEEGILAAMLDPLIGETIAVSSQIQRTWLGAGNVLFLRYEDFLDNEYPMFEKIVEYCRLDIDRDRLHEIIRYNVFERVSGRKRGVEDTASHLRKGIVGDWKNHFTARIKDEFKKLYGDLLIKTGYEKDPNW